MATAHAHTPRRRRSPRPRPSLLTVLRGIFKAFILLFLTFMILNGLAGWQTGIAERFNGLFLLALLGASLAYWLYVSSQVHLSVPGLKKALKGQDAASVTIQVPRLSSDMAHVTIANRAWLPVLRAALAIELDHDPGATNAGDAAITTSKKGRPFSLRARSTQTVELANVFDHVGIFRLRSTGVRIYDLLCLVSRVCGASGQWRVRVVPNIYRLPFGIPKERRLGQDSLGLPSSPADALDYDRVRDYRPGDPLKTIHWKLVAHSQGELYTKLFETPTISTVTLVIDPYDPGTGGSADAAYHLHDTMLEGGFSLLEHARENDIAGRLCFVGRSGSLVEAAWAGSAMLGWFVETARRPSSTLEAHRLSIGAIRSLRNRRFGYVIFATSSLTEDSVEALIDCHRAGVALLVVHALPSASNAGSTQQRAFDDRLRRASIGVVGLTDGPQIVQEVMPS